MVQEVKEMKLKITPLNNFYKHTPGPWVEDDGHIFQDSD